MKTLSVISCLIFHTAALAATPQDAQQAVLGMCSAARECNMQKSDAILLAVVTSSLKNGAQEIYPLSHLLEAAKSKLASPPNTLAEDHVARLLAQPEASMSEGIGWYARSAGVIAGARGSHEAASDHELAVMNMLNSSPVDWDDVYHAAVDGECNYYNATCAYSDAIDLLRKAQSSFNDARVRYENFTE